MFPAVESDKQFIVGFCSGVLLSLILTYWKQTKRVQPSQEIICRATKNKKKIASDLKMVIVVRKDLKLAKHELATKCVHACIEAFKESLLKNPNYVEKWHRWGAKKIALKVNSEADLLVIKRSADENNLVNSLTRDPDHLKNTALTLAIGPDSCQEIDAITGHLKLL